MNDNIPNSATPPPKALTKDDFYTVRSDVRSIVDAHKKRTLEMLEDLSKPYGDIEESDKMPLVAKPLPLGVIPKYIHNGQRIKDIKEAMVRYTSEGLQVPQSWIDELNELQQNKFNETR